MFEGQVPLLYRRILVVDGKRIFEACRPRLVQVRRKGRREAEVLPAAVGGVVSILVQRNKAGTHRPAGNQGEAQRRFDKPSPPAADHGAVVMVRPPRKPDARTIVALIGVAQLLRKAGLRGRQDRRRCNRRSEPRIGIRKSLRIRHRHSAMNTLLVIVRQEGSRVVVRILQRGMYLVPETCIDRQVRRHLPVILTKERIGVTQSVHGRVRHLCQGSVIRVAQQKRCIRIANRRSHSARRLNTYCPAR